MNHFARIAEGIDVQPLLAAIEANPKLWEEITARQKTPGSPHHDTQAIILRWCESQTIQSVFTDIPAVDYPAYAKLPEARPLMNKVFELAEGFELGRVIIADLKPGGKIDKHLDEGAYADYYDRFHLVLTSDPGNRFFVEYAPGCQEWVEMKPGELWWFNHKQPHFVENESSSGRIHLIVDMVSPKWRRWRRRKLSA